MTRRGSSGGRARKWRNRSLRVRLFALMTAKLDKTIKRELEIEGRTYTIAIGPEGLKVTEKGRCNGPEMSWRSIISGESTLRAELNRSIDATGG